MPGYLVLESEITDPEKYETYKQMAGSSIERYGGRYLVRGGNPQVLEGDWSPKRVVILEFSSVEQAKAWFNSPEYAPAKALRKQAARIKMVAVEGI
jgi:uncharacterized protein (DUF1330 family)